MISSIQSVGCDGAVKVYEAVCAKNHCKVKGISCRVALKSGKVCAIKSGKFLLNGKWLEGRRVEEDGREGVFERRSFEEEEITVGEEAADDFGARGGVDGEAEVADGDFAVVADAEL